MSITLQIKIILKGKVITMGVLSDAVKSIDQSEKNFEEIQESLNLLVQLAESKANAYEQQIKDDLFRGKILGKKEGTDTLFFPISTIKDYRKQYRCITENTVNTKILDTIATSITDMIDDPSGKGIVTGVAQIINTALEPILGVAKGQEQYCSATTTFIEGTGLGVNIVRFDCIIWARSIQSESIRKKVQTALSCVAFKSVVDVEKLKFDDFRSVYAPILEASDEKDPLAAIQKARDIYDALNGGKALPAQNSALITMEDLDIQDICFASAPIMATEHADRF